MVKNEVASTQERRRLCDRTAVFAYLCETDTLDKMKARVEYDLEYLRNWSLGLDLQIVVRTVRLVFFDRNAY